MTTFAFTSGDPSHLAAGSNASMADMQGPFIDIRTFLNGNISDINLSSSAAINENKLATGSAGLAKGTFSAYRNAALTLATNNVAVFDAEEFDVSGWYDTTTGRYMPLAAGYFRLSWVMTASIAWTATAYLSTVLRKNGVAFKFAPVVYQAGTTLPVVGGGTAIVSANGSTDYFEVEVRHNQGGSPAFISGASGPSSTYFQGELIGRS